MTDPGAPDERPAPQAGSRTSPAGTPVPVDLTRDRRVRTTWAVFLAGPVIWFAHFGFVYLVAEAGCTGDGRGLDVLDPPVPVLATVVATVVAVVLCTATAAWGWRRWRTSVDALDRAPDGGEGTEDPALTFDADARSGSLGFAGAILSLFSLIAVLFTAAPAVVLWSC